MLYGAITRIDRSGNHVTYMREYVPHTWFTEAPPQKFSFISSSPLPMPHDLKSWYVLKGVITGQHDYSETWSIYIWYENFPIR